MISIHRAVKKQKTSNSFESPVRLATNLKTNTTSNVQRFVSPLIDPTKKLITSPPSLSETFDVTNLHQRYRGHLRSNCQDESSKGFIGLDFSKVPRVSKSVLTSNRKECPDCYCYICEIPAALCDQWDDFHCLAHPQDPIWKALKEEQDLNLDARAENFKASAEKYKVLQLKNCLRENGQHVTGKKSILIDRIVDAKQFGCLANCPKCGKGRPKLIETSTREAVYCPGSFVGDQWEFCNYVSLSQDAPRCGPWKDHDSDFGVDKENKKLSHVIAAAKACTSQIRSTEKVTTSEANASSSKTGSETFMYDKYKKLKVYELKALLRKNGQHTTGNKDTLLAWVIDGVKYGRLDHCPKCGTGRLKLHENHPETIFCPGRFDAYFGMSVPCAGNFECQADDAPRSGPWLD